MLFRLIALLFAISLTACAPMSAGLQDRINYTAVGTSLPGKPTGCALDIYATDQPVERPTQTVGDLVVGETGIWMTCNESDMLSVVKQEACAKGADAVKINKSYQSGMFDKGGGCYVISASFLKYEAALSAAPASSYGASAAPLRPGVAAVSPVRSPPPEAKRQDRVVGDSREGAVALSPTPGEAVVYAHRKALVIGNDNYRNVPKLLNAVYDALSIANALSTVGYQVFAYTNVDEKAFKQALRDFRLQIEGGDEVLVFYAGHGVQLGTANYLLPVDIKGDNEEQVKDEAIQLQRILDDLQERKAKFSLAIIDACRDNPFKSSGRAIGGRGLAPTTAATGQMIMFSAGSGQRALDKLGDNDTERNGLFTRVLMREMVRPAITVDRVLRNVRNDVVSMARKVGHEQTPALYDQAVGDFYFNK